MWITYLAPSFGKPLAEKDNHLTYDIEAGGFNRAYNTSPLLWRDSPASKGLHHAGNTKSEDLYQL